MGWLRHGIVIPETSGTGRVLGGQAHLDQPGHLFLSFCTSLLLASIVGARIAAVSINPAILHFRKRSYRHP